jgi:hypothetical protein
MGQADAAAFDHLADDLMAGNDCGQESWQVTFSDVEVGTADTAGKDADEYMSRQQLWARNVFDLDQSIRSREFRIVDSSLQFDSNTDE